MAEFMKHQCDDEAPDNQDLGCEMIVLKHGNTELAATLRKYAEEQSTVPLCLQMSPYFYSIWGLIADIFKSKDKVRLQAQRRKPPRQ